MATICKARIIKQFEHWIGNPFKMYVCAKFKCSKMFYILRENSIIKKIFLTPLMTYERRLNLVY